MTMPASGFFAEGDRDTPLVSMGPSNVNPIQSHAARLENQNALQIALELTLLQLNKSNNSQPLAEVTQNVEMEAYLAAEEKKKGSQNMTECVPVPSSEHVAEIVGRQGCKIKALRAKTNTYIKTPVRGEEPVFVVTGRSEDVANAKVEIMSAADHFSQIRACRKNNSNGSMAPGPPNVPGRVTYEVKVPYRVVGLVVGPKGATIKRIQQQTQTYIVTPSREKDPIFEVTGLPENVCLARKEIEAHIAMRTGTESNTPVNTAANVYDEQVAAAALAITASRNESQPLDNFMSNQEFISNLYKYSEGSTNSLNVGLHNSNGMNGSSNLHFTNSLGGMNASLGNGMNSLPGMASINNDHVLGGLHSMNGYGNDIGTFSNSENSLYPNGRATMDMLPPIGSQLLTGKHNGLSLSNGLYDDSTERPNDHSNFATPGTSIWSDVGKILGTPLGMAVSQNRGFSSAVGGYAKVVPFASANNSNTVSPEFDIHPQATRSSSDPNCLRNQLAGFPIPAMDPSPSPSTQSLSSSPELAVSEDRTAINGMMQTTKCIVCRNSNVVAALIPCGHNLFCLECANGMVHNKTQCKSPVCDQIPTDSIRILRSNRA